MEPWPVSCSGVRVDSLVDWSIGRLVDYPFGCLAGWAVVWISSWAVDKMLGNR